MTTVEQLVQLYEQGCITSHFLLIETLMSVDSEYADVIMSILPPDIVSEVKEFVDQYRPGEMVSSNDRIPSWDSIQVVKEWLARHANGKV
jgi:hypothetical protein